MLHDGDVNPATLTMLIPIIAVTISLVALIVWIVVSHQRRMRELDCRHQERMAAIEKGLLELPPESTAPEATTPPHSRYLLRGLIWLGVGVAITFGGRDWWNGRPGIVGWIAVAVGASYLIFYFVEARKAPKREPAAGADGAP